MFLRKSEHRRTNPYVAMTIGTLAMVGAFHVVRTGKRTIRCVCDKMRSMIKHDKGCDCHGMTE
jgi:hypothetical protein